MGNRLARASSPYLLQHKDNPVDWYEWGEEAFAAARASDLPILLSVGYSACHWCHVMAHESFEDEQTAVYMNAHFVNVKVDREERPDVDRIYMDAVQAMTGHGGWPMTVFLDHDGRPFFAGTYFPKEPRGHHPTFQRVMEAVTDAWRHRRDELGEQAARLTAAIRATLPASERPVDKAVIGDALTALTGTFDWEHGGFGGAPKFPQAPNLELLLRTIALDATRDQPAAEMLTFALDRMATGGIYDHIGGGFARYAVDELWLVPHFEKMLYDNALLARVYLRAGQLLDRPDYTTVARETLDYLLRDMRHPEGGIYSAEDADSEGVEGKFYVWTSSEVAEVAAADAPLIMALYGVTDAGNFEGRNILHLPTGLAATADAHGVPIDELRSIKARFDAALLDRRSRRVRPGLDDKIVTAWNGLALRAFAEAGAVLGDPRYLDAATGIAEFARARLMRHDGRLYRSWRDGRATVLGFCDDYAAMVVGLLTLYQAAGDERWFVMAESLGRAMLVLFSDPRGGFYGPGIDADELIARPKNLMDNPTPSDNSLAAEALQMLAAYTGDAALREHYEGVLRASGPLVTRYPTAAGHLLSVIVSDPPREVAIVGTDPDRAPYLRVVWEAFRPDVVVALGPSDGIPLLARRTADGGARAYVCRDFVCDVPATDPTELHRQLEPIVAG